MVYDLETLLEGREVILVFAGAGMSADSGLPTYRDKEGFWKDYPPYRDIDKDYVAMMSPHGFASDPHFAWGFFVHQYRLYKNAVPHRGYEVLLQLCRSRRDFFVVTSNVDGMFLKAGFPKEKLHEAHGTIHRMQCSIPCHHDVWEVENLEVEVNYSTMRAKDTLPLCPHCGGISRPNIFMYGDTMESYIDIPVQQSAKRFRAFRQKYRTSSVAILEIGVGAEGIITHIEAYKKMFGDMVHLCINPRQERAMIGGYWIPLSVEEALINMSSDNLSL